MPHVILPQFLVYKYTTNVMSWRSGPTNVFVISLALSSSFHGCIRAKEKSLIADYARLCSVEEAFFRQKSRIRWLAQGDSNTAYFHKTVKARNAANRVDKILTSDGTVLTEPNDIRKEAVDYFKNLYREQNATLSTVAEIDHILQFRLSHDHIESMSRPVTPEEIRSTMFGLKGDKAPGPDGYTAHFFKASWDLTGNDVTRAILSFFKSGSMLREANATAITLVPKSDSPNSMSDFRPIACCNTVYKCISKIIANRLKCFMPDFIDQAQTAFVKGRSIMDNILLAQEILRDYHRDNKPPRCAIKLDWMKAYDTINWNFLFNILEAIGVPGELLQCIKQCVSTAMFSISINGGLVDYFKAERGLRQGDPISPYLFILGMEVLSRMLNRMTNMGGYRYHRMCDRVRLNHLCFADDVLIFSHGSFRSIEAVHYTLQKFSAISGLQANPLKTSVFFSGIDKGTCQAIVHLTRFKEGKLPVKYLGVPLLSTLLTYSDCIPLIERISSRIKSWLSRFLSFAGRLQLIHSVLFSIQVFWSSVFILPRRVILEVEKQLRAFLWTGTDTNLSGAKVNWDTVCLPKQEGGLGIKDLQIWNEAAVAKNLWRCFVDTKSLWIKWVHAYRLRGDGIWNINTPASCSWSWRKLLHIREQVRPHIIHKVGNGTNTLLWHDNWHPFGPLLPRYGERIVQEANSGLRDRVAIYVQNGAWRWPLPRSPDLAEIFETGNSVSTSLEPDKVIWDLTCDKKFSIRSLWNFNRHKVEEVQWSHFVWFSKAIKKHAFCLWLAIRGALTTQDRIKGWGMSGANRCYLCGSDEETRDHLFFACDLSSSIWRDILRMCLITDGVRTWDDTVIWAANSLKGRSFAICVRRLALAASVYTLWRERNERYHNNNCKDKRALTIFIRDQVRLRVASFKTIEDTPVNRQLCENWGFELRHISM